MRIAYWYTQKVQFFDSVFAGQDIIFSLSGIFWELSKTAFGFFVAQIGPELVGGALSAPPPYQEVLENFHMKNRVNINTKINTISWSVKHEIILFTLYYRNNKKMLHETTIHIFQN